MNYWDSVGRWINTLLMFIVGVIGFDTLFRLLDANESNVIVGVVHFLSLLFLVPFGGMFGEQDFVLTALMAVLGYAVLVGIALGVLRSLQATRWTRHPAPLPPQPNRPARTSSPPAQRTPPQRPQATRAAAQPSQPARTSPRPGPAAPTARTAPATAPPKPGSNGKARETTAAESTSKSAKQSGGSETNAAEPPDDEKSGSTAPRAASKSRTKG
jgi:hypothetical protein